MSRIRQGTYSIVARDAATGELGVAVQSHWFSVGSVVSWARPGVGAVATQANAEISYGPRLLEALAGGGAPDSALRRLLGDDPGAPARQVAVVAGDGRVAVHTGEDCIAEAGHRTGDAVSCQANIMVTADVWPAMLETYEGAAGESLSERLLRALEAAEAHGGDLRGRQSAALLVVPADGPAWARTVDVRVDDHPEPLAELRRLVAVADAYRLAEEGDEHVGTGRHDAAAAAFERASALAPGNGELLFWAALGAAQAGELDTGVARMREAISLHAGWRDLLDRLTPRTAPSAAALREALADR